MADQQLPTLSELSRHEQDRVFELQNQGLETRDALVKVLEERNPQPVAPQPEALELLKAVVDGVATPSKDLDTIDKLIAEVESPLENLSDPHDQIRA